MAEGLRSSSLRTPQRSLGTTSGRMMREARKLERQGFGGAAESVALAASKQKLTERPGFSSADSEMALQPLRESAAKKEAAIRSGFGAQDSRQKLFADMQARAASGMTGAEGAAALAGFRSRAAQLGVAADRFDATASGKLGIDLRSMAAPAAPATTPTTPTTPATTPTTPATTPTSSVAPPATTPATPPAAATTPPQPVGKIGGKPAADVLRDMRKAATPALTPEQTAASGDIGDFTNQVRELEANMPRRDAVAEVNRQRASAGLAPFEPAQVYDTLLSQSRQRSADKARKREVEKTANAVGEFFTETAPDALQGVSDRAGSLASRVAGGVAKTASALRQAAREAAPAPAASSAGPQQPQGLVAGLLQRGRENVKDTAFEGSTGYKAAEAVGEFVTETTPEALRKARNRASSVAQTANSLRQAARGAALGGVKKATRGTGFEGSKIDRRIFGP